MITVLVWIVIVAALGSLAIWALGQFAPPDPVNRVARVVIIGICVLLILGLAASLFGVNTGIPVPVTP